MAIAATSASPVVVVAGLIDKVAPLPTKLVFCCTSAIELTVTVNPFDHVDSFGGDAESLKDTFEICVPAMYIALPVFQSVPSDGSPAFWRWSTSVLW